MNDKNILKCDFILGTGCIPMRKERRNMFLNNLCGILLTVGTYSFVWDWNFQTPAATMGALNIYSHTDISISSGAV